MKYFGAIEAGGTKFVCSIAADPEHYIAEARFPTTLPEETFRRCVDFFRQNIVDYPIAALGIASFGPVDLNPDSPSYGFITSTPKAGWQNTDIVGYFRRELNIPVGFDTDVNGAALAEYTWGNPKHVRSLVYYTIGTGVGGGTIVDGKPVHGLVHPEAGHIYVSQDRSIDPYAGCCPFHGNCLEGLCSGPSILGRFGVEGHKLSADDPFWGILANYIAQACVSQICTLSPEKIVLGGGVMQQEQLFPMIRHEVQRLLNGYVQHPMILEHIDEYITAPVLGNRAGACGAIALAKTVLVDENHQVA